MAGLSNIVFWMWAQQAFGPGSGTPWHIHKSFPGGLEGFYRAGPRCWNNMDYVSEVQSESLALCTVEESMARLEYAVKLGWQVVTPECEQYPRELRNISDPPAVLYIKGAKPVELAGPKVAVVGARKALRESLDAAKSIGYQLATAGGGAVCVLPVDLSSPYMAKTAHLRRRVLELGGALMTEYFSQRSPAQGGFQLRNRLITGLCRRVVLVQAAEKSGTMIYARHAAGQGRKLYVFPGPPEAEEFAGSRRLLKEGAAPVYSGSEVLGTDRAIAMEPPAPAAVKKPEREPPEEKEPPKRHEMSLRKELSQRQELSLEQQAVLDRLGGGTLTVDELMEGCGMEMGKLLRLLTRMEMQGLIESAPGRRYRRPGKL